MSPLVRVVRLWIVERGRLGGEAMDRAKEAIQASFNNDEKKYEDILDH